jgi:hypothetical protein
MAAHDLSFTNARDQRLYASCVLPKKAKDIKAAMVFCHGYAEHSHRKLAGNLSLQQRMTSSSDVVLLAARQAVPSMLTLPALAGVCFAAFQQLADAGIAGEARISTVLGVTPMP